MSWKYRARKYINVWGKPRYRVVEFYPGNTTGYCEAAPLGSTKKELIQDLEAMLRDVKRYRTMKAKQ